MSAATSRLARGGLALNRNQKYPTGLIPRLRGPDFGVLVLRSLVEGSSPLARGGPEPVDVVVVVAGLIPARAGRT